MVDDRFRTFDRIDERGDHHVSSSRTSRGLYCRGSPARVLRRMAPPRIASTATAALVGSGGPVRTSPLR